MPNPDYDDKKPHCYSDTQIGQLEDADTADIFTEISRGIDKWFWFVEAHGQAPRQRPLAK